MLKKVVRSASSRNKKGKEAAKTSILSRRWLKLWAWIPALDFDAKNFFNFYMHRTDPAPPGFENLKLKYSDWVNKVMKSYERPIIDAFRVDFFLDYVDKWLDFVVERKVKRLELHLTNHHYYVKKN